MRRTGREEGGKEGKQRWERKTGGKKREQEERNGNKEERKEKRKLGSLMR